MTSMFSWQNSISLCPALFCTPGKTCLFGNPRPWLWHKGSQFPGQGWNPGPLNWEHGVLATGQPGKSHALTFFHVSDKRNTLVTMQDIPVVFLCLFDLAWGEVTLLFLNH